MKQIIIWTLAIFSAIGLKAQDYQWAGSVSGPSLLYGQTVEVDGSKLMSSRHLGHFEPLLSDGNFFRPHKSHLINLDQLRSYMRQEGGYLLMKNGAQVPLARGQRAALFMILGIKPS